jgi:hypothetical protein
MAEVRVELLQYLPELHLPTIREILEEVARQAE